MVNIRNTKRFYRVVELGDGDSGSQPIFIPKRKGFPQIHTY